MDPLLGADVHRELVDGDRAQCVRLVLVGDETDPGVVGRDLAVGVGRGRGAQQVEQVLRARRVPDVSARALVHGAQPGTVRGAFLENHVEVRATETHGRGRRPASRAARVPDPGTGTSVDVERRIVEVDGAVGALDIDRRREDPMVEAERELDERGRASGTLGVSDLRLDAADRGEVLLPRRRAHDGVQRGELRTVADLRAGGVCLDKLDRGRLATGVLVSPLQGYDLPLRARGINALEAPVAGCPDAADDGVDTVAVTFGIGQPLEREHADALADQGAVSGIVEGADRVGPGQRLGLAEAHEAEERVLRVAAAGDHEVGPFLDEFAHGHLDGRQRAGTRRVDRVVRSAEVQPVRDPTGGHVAEQAGEGVLLPCGKGERELRRDRFGVSRTETAAAYDLLQHGCLQPCRHRMRHRHRPGHA